MPQSLSFTYNITASEFNLATWGLAGSQRRFIFESRLGPRRGGGFSVYRLRRMQWHDHNDRSSSNVLSTQHTQPLTILCIQLRSYLNRIARNCLQSTQHASSFLPIQRASTVHIYLFFLHGTSETILCSQYISSSPLCSSQSVSKAQRAIFYLHNAQQYFYLHSGSYSIHTARTATSNSRQPLYSVTVWFLNRSACSRFLSNVTYRTDFSIFIQQVQFMLYLYSTRSPKHF